MTRLWLIKCSCLSVLVKKKLFTICFGKSSLVITIKIVLSLCLSLSYRRDSISSWTLLVFLFSFLNLVYIRNLWTLWYSMLFSTKHSLFNKFVSIQTTLSSLCFKIVTWSQFTIFLVLFYNIIHYRWSWFIFLPNLYMILRLVVILEQLHWPHIKNGLKWIPYIFIDSNINLFFPFN